MLQPGHAYFFVPQFISPFPLNCYQFFGQIAFKHLALIDYGDSFKQCRIDVSRKNPAFRTQFLFCCAVKTFDTDFEATLFIFNSACKIVCTLFWHIWEWLVISLNNQQRSSTSCFTCSMMAVLRAVYGLPHRTSLLVPSFCKITVHFF